MLIWYEYKLVYYINQIFFSIFFLSGFLWFDISIRDGIQALPCRTILTIFSLGFNE